MSILQPRIADARVLDLCAGSGALGLELLSRGAAHCDFVERDPKVLRVLTANIATLGAEDRSTVHRGDALRFVDAVASPYDVAVADPPYRQGIAEALAQRWLAAPFATIFCVEHEAGLQLPEPAAGASSDRRAYGDTVLTFYRLSPS